MFAGMKNVKNHGKNGFKEAMKGLKEKKKHFIDHRPVSVGTRSCENSLSVPVNSKLDWSDKLAAIFEAKLVINRLSSSVPFYCICRRGWHYFSGNVPRFNVFILI